MTKDHKPYALIRSMVSFFQVHSMLLLTLRVIGDSEQPSEVGL